MFPAGLELCTAASVGKGRRRERHTADGDPPAGKVAKEAVSVVAVRALSVSAFEATQGQDARTVNPRGAGAMGTRIC